MTTWWKRAAAFLLLSLPHFGCRGELDAGYDVPRGPLPVDARSALVTVNDGAFDNWQGEYAVLLAATRQLQLAGIIVNESPDHPSLETNFNGYTQMIAAAQQSGMRYLPAPIASHAPPLVRPSSARIEDTTPNDSDGARLILLAAKRWGTIAHPLTIATGGALTDVADAYLIDPSLADRVVVVSSLGQSEGTGARVLGPNGNRDQWATFIVTSRLRYVQVNAYYNQLADVPEARVPELPANAFGAWIAGKRAQILALTSASDQVSVLASALLGFAQDVTRMHLDDADPTLLDAQTDGPLWHVASGDADLARQAFWDALSNPDTFQ